MYSDRINAARKRQRTGREVQAKGSLIRINVSSLCEKDLWLSAEYRLSASRLSVQGGRQNAKPLPHVRRNGRSFTCTVSFNPLGSGYYFYLYFTEEKTSSERLSNLLKVIQLVSSRART